MNILENLAMKLGYYKAARAYPEILRVMADVEKLNIPTGDVYRNQADLYRHLSWIQAAVGITSRAAAGQKLNVLQMVGEEEKDIPNHPLELRIQKPNEKQSRFEFLEETYSFRALTGNSYWWLNKASESAEPDEIWCIPSYKIEPVPDGNLFLKGYKYSPGGGYAPISLEPWEVVHFRTFNPINEFVGLSPIEALAVVSTGDLKMQDWNTRLFGENNARMPGILAFADAIGDPQWDKIKRDANDAANKRKLMMLRNVGKGGVEWIQAAMSMRDMEFLEGRTFTKEEIFSIYAPGLSSMLAVNATEANSKTGKATFAEFTLWPLLSSVAEKISKDLLPVYGENLQAEFDDPRQSDRLLELQEQAEYSKVHTINEIRQEHYGDDPLDDERGEMLPAQIGSVPVQLPLEPEPVPEQLQPFNQPPQEEQLPEEEQEPEAPEPPEAEPTPQQPDELPQKREDRAMNDDLAKWRRKATKALENGKPADVPFDSDVIPAILQERIIEALKSARSMDAIRDAFQVEGLLPSLTVELQRANNLLERTLAR